MANPLYQQLIGGSPVSQKPMSRIAQFQSMMNAMRNPSGFVKQAFPDIPDEIRDDPNRVLGYLQQTRGISNETVQQMMAELQMFTRR